MSDVHAVRTLIVGAPMWFYEACVDHLCDSWGSVGLSCNEKENGSKQRQAKHKGGVSLFPLTCCSFANSYCACPAVWLSVRRLQSLLPVGLLCGCLLHGCPSCVAAMPLALFVCRDLRLLPVLLYPWAFVCLTSSVPFMRAYMGWISPIQMQSFDAIHAGMDRWVFSKAMVMVRGFTLWACACWLPAMCVVLVAFYECAGFVHFS
mmetsp:Transcript_35759/g.102812  ORF Transcript_35759/g.102812 Transcript_35759/m.102812 type:complete len:205 (+) Transcript_35759:824-1438(+)